MNDDKTDPKGQSDKTTDPSKSQDGKSTDTGDKKIIPEKLEGKTVEQIAQMYSELEKVYGKHSEEVKQYRDQIIQWESLGRIIQSNPALYQAISDEIKKVSGTSQSDKTDGDKTVKPKTRDDTRLALENTLVSSFEGKYGIDKLDGEKKKQLHLKIGRELADMLDPGGNKTYGQILDEISLEKLPSYLEKAYKLVTVGDEEEKERVNAFLQSQRGGEGAIGSISSSGGKSESIVLTPAQREVARKMGISEKDYLENYKAIQ